jgi:STAM-binding protein
MKYCNLIITLLPKHPEYNVKAISTQRAVILVNQNAIVALDSLEKIKTELKARIIAQEVNSQKEILEVKQNEQVVKRDTTEVLTVPGTSKETPSTNWWKVESSEMDHQRSQKPIPEPTMVNSQMASTSLVPPLPHFPRHSEPAGVALYQPPSSHLASPVVSDTPPPLPPKPAALQQSSSSGSNLLSPNSGQLRSLFVPTSLVTKFLEVAQPNTNKNLETCGILCGKLQRNQLHVTHLLIPPQTATSGKCTSQRYMFHY